MGAEEHAADAGNSLHELLQWLTFAGQQAT
jgi:hypothetical protein